MRPIPCSGPSSAARLPFSASSGPPSGSLSASSPGPAIYFATCLDKSVGSTSPSPTPPLCVISTRALQAGPLRPSKWATTTIFCMHPPGEPKPVAGTCHARGEKEGLPPPQRVYIPLSHLDLTTPPPH